MLTRCGFTLIPALARWRLEGPGVQGHPQLHLEFKVNVSVISLPLLKHHDQGNLQKKEFICGLWSQRVKVYDSKAEEQVAESAVSNR